MDWRLAAALLLSVRMASATVSHSATEELDVVCVRCTVRMYSARKGARGTQRKTHTHWAGWRSLP